jgi:hypothetical protein
MGRFDLVEVTTWAVLTVFVSLHTFLTYYPAINQWDLIKTYHVIFTDSFSL